MSSSTLVPVHHIGRLCAFISSINHAHCILRFVRFLCILWRDSCENISTSWRTVCIGIQVHALRMNIKLNFRGTLGGCMVCSLVKSDFSCIASYRVQLIVRPDVTFIQECVCACGYRKRESLISLVHVSSFLQVGRSSQARSQVLRLGGENTFLGDKIFVFVESWNRLLGNYVTFHFRSPLRSPLQSLL